MTTPTITEADRATARRAIRRHVGAGPRMNISCAPGISGRAIERVRSTRKNGHPFFRVLYLLVRRDVFDAACLAAAQGRAYAAALKGSK